LGYSSHLIFYAAVVLVNLLQKPVVIPELAQAGHSVVWQLPVEVCHALCQLLKLPSDAVVKVTVDEVDRWEGW
jgi:hypothetical protein